MLEKIIITILKEDLKGYGFCTVEHIADLFKNYDFTEKEWDELWEIIYNSEKLNVITAQNGISYFILQQKIWLEEFANGDFLSDNDKVWIKYVKDEEGCHPLNYYVD